MMALPFTASCQRGHDLIEFTEREPFERHMTEVHKARKLTTGGRGGMFDTKAAHGFSAGKFEPYPWAAPKAPKDTRNLAAVLVAAGDDVTDVSGVPGFVSEGVFRYDKPEDGPAPLESLPATVRPIVAGAVARGEMWLVSVNARGGVRVEVGRKAADGQPEAWARLTIVGGKVSRTELRTAESQCMRAAKITDVKRLFQAA
jgi:hypothetical protein